MKRGDIVYDVADPRHVGRIVTVFHTCGRTFCNIVWLETGWRGYLVDANDLRKATQEQWQ